MRGQADRGEPAGREADFARICARDAAGWLEPSEAPRHRQTRASPVYRGQQFEAFTVDEAVSEAWALLISKRRGARPRSTTAALLSDGPDLAALAWHARRVRVTDDVPLGPSPGREVLPGPVEHAMRIHHRLGLQTRISLPSCRLGGLLGCAFAELLRHDHACA